LFRGSAAENNKGLLLRRSEKFKCVKTWARLFKRNVVAILALNYILYLGVKSTGLNAKINERQVSETISFEQAGPVRAKFAYNMRQPA
jgi:hypothetical protein